MLPLDLELPDDVGDDPIHLTLSLDLAGNSGQTVFIVHEGAVLVFTRETTLTDFTPVEIVGSPTLRDAGDKGVFRFDRANGDAIELELGFFDIDDARELINALESSEPDVPDGLDAGAEPRSEKPDEEGELAEPDDEGDAQEIGSTNETTSSDELAAAAHLPYEDDDDLDRVPCPDGSCVGTLDSQGRCRYCGTQGQAPVRSSSGDEEPAAEALFDDAEPPAEADDDEDEAPDSTDGDWDDRELCPDGSCTGTMGSDGRCRECGRQR